MKISFCGFLGAFDFGVMPKTDYFPCPKNRLLGGGKTTIFSRKIAYFPLVNSRFSPGK